jgi:nucleotide-binding universal stress UspA family protein
VSLIEHILFPIDFSEPCRQIWQQVQAMVKQFGARLSILHAMQIPPPWYGEAEALRFAALVDVAALKVQREVELNRFLADELQALNPVRVLVESDPARAITEFATDQKVDLMMMPTRGAGYFRRFLLGSVTAKVLHDSTCPVWTSVHASEGRTVEGLAYRVVLCAVDLQDGSVPLLAWASGFAAAHRAVVRAIHVIPAVEEHSQNRGSIEVRRYLYEKARERWDAIRNEARIDMELCLAGGSVADGVRATALSQSASAIVIGRGHLQKALGSLRSGAYQIIREAPCPVIRV